jgi:hypothetical protein
VQLRRVGVVAAAGAGYLAVSVVLWWHLWAVGLGHGIVAGGYGDPDQDVWFLAWVPHALSHGLNPFFSRAMFAPKGINLTVNTSILLPSLVMTPVTELFGPLVSFNVAVVLAPALSSLTAFAAFRRWAPWAPGRWLACLLYGFSPFVLNDLSSGHLHLTILVFPPLALVLFDDLLVRQHGNAVTKGALLGLVFAAQFLTGQELMAIMAMVALCGIAILALRHPGEAKRRWRRAATGLASGVILAGVLLAVPVYELLAGPRRFAGTVFPAPYGFCIVLRTWLWPLGGWPQATAASYLGLPILLVVAVACWRIRDGTLRFAAAMAAVALMFGLGRSIHWSATWSTHIPLPDAIFSHWPLLKNLLPVRFVLMINLFLALALAITFEHVRAWWAARQTSTLPGSSRRLVASLVSLGLGVVVLASPALGSPIPYSIRRIAVPAVYQSRVLRDLPAGTILLGFPLPNGFFADPLVWQAQESMPYDLVAGYGFIPSPAGSLPTGQMWPSTAYQLFQEAQVGLLPRRPDPADVAGLRADLSAWHVSVVVEYVGYGALVQPDELAAVVDEATGVTPLRVDGAWVWRLPLPAPTKGPASPAG